jgi:RNA polymerase sigma-70 factor (ECF subfamily)
VAWQEAVLEQRAWLEGLIGRRVGSLEAAPDLVQETLLAAVQGGEPPGGARSLRAWLGGIARNKVRRHFELRRRELRLAERLLARAGEESSSAETLDWVLRSERIECAERALAQIEPLEARLLHCRYYLQWSYAQIGCELSLNRDAVTNGLRRAKQSLRARVEELSKKSIEP